MKSRKFKIIGKIPVSLQNDISKQNEIRAALKQKDTNKLTGYGLDFKLIEDGLRILKTKR